MASNRIVIDQTKQMGSVIRAAAQAGSLFRAKLAELNDILGANGYNADASLATDAGLSAADQTRLQNLVIQANNEMSGTFTTAVGIGATGGTKQLLDGLSVSF